MSAPPGLHVVAAAPPTPATDGARGALSLLVTSTVDALRTAARAGMARSVCACEALCDQIDDALARNDASTACLLLECVAREPAARVLLARLFACGGHLARSDNPFIVYRACVQLLALGRRDLRLDNHAGLLVDCLRRQARPALARRLGRLLEAAR